jgi:amino acid transporter
MLNLKTAIAGILAVRLIVQFIGQTAGLMILRKRWGPERFPFKMWLYPVPAVLTILGWGWLFWHTGPARKWGLLQIAMGVVANLVWSWDRKQWPFAEAGGQQLANVEEK